MDYQKLERHLLSMEKKYGSGSNMAGLRSEVEVLRRKYFNNIPSNAERSPGYKEAFRIYRGLINMLTERTLDALGGTVKTEL